MRPFARIVLALLIIAGAGFLLLGYWAGHDDRRAPGSVGTTGAINTEKARERAAELGEKAAAASAKVQETVTEAGFTAKIKAKMALDDSVKARSIDVTTTGSVVTLTGDVRSVAEHDRAIALARETVGVTQVVDRLRVAR